MGDTIQKEDKSSNPGFNGVELTGQSKVGLTSKHLPFYVQKQLACGGRRRYEQIHKRSKRKIT
jgi:hypothetical protein